MHSKNHKTCGESGVGVGHSEYFSDTSKIDRNLIKTAAQLYVLILKKLHKYCKITWHFL